MIKTKNANGQRIVIVGVDGIMHNNVSLYKVRTISICRNKNLIICNDCQVKHNNLVLERKAFWYVGEESDQ